MALTSCSSILKLLGALSSCASALRSYAGRSSTLTAAPADSPWELRPAARTALPACVLTPTKEKHYRHAKRLLRSIHLHALDRVPLFVILSSESEVPAWTAVTAGKGPVLAPHVALTLEGVMREAEPGELDAAQGNFSAVLDKIERADSSRCHLGAGFGRGIGGVKKLYGARHLGEKFGCEVVWVMDCESLPMRTFSFVEAFSRLGAVWLEDERLARFRKMQGDPLAGLEALNRRDLGCVKTAQRIHGLALSQRVRELLLRQNDFWLYETRLLRQMMAGAVRGLPAGTGFAEAFARGGQVSEQILWNTWLAQTLLNGHLSKYTNVNYTIVNVASTSKALARSFANSSWVPGSKDLFKEAVQSPSFSWMEFGRYWYGVLGQAGIYGDYLEMYQPDYTAFQDFVMSVPWCVSNCNRPKMQKMLSPSARAA